MGQGQWWASTEYHINDPLNNTPDSQETNRLSTPQNTIMATQILSGSPEILVEHLRQWGSLLRDSRFAL